MPCTQPLMNITVAKMPTDPTMEGTKEMMMLIMADSAASRGMK